MKKAAIAVLCLLLVLFSAAVTAESAENSPRETVEVEGKFSITCTVPEGYLYEETPVTDMLIIGSLEAEDGIRPSILFAIAESEEYAGRTLNDFTDEEMDAQIELAKADMAEPSVSIMETVYGTKLIVTQEMAEANSALDITTVYQGYYITFYMYPALDGTVLTEEQINLAIDFISDLWIVEK